MPTFPKSTGDVPTAADWNSLNVLLGQATADGTSGSLTVSGIPQTHRLLLISVHGFRVGSGTSNVSVRPNNDNGTNYRWVRSDIISGTPSTSSPDSGISDTRWNVGLFGSSTFGSTLHMEIPNYAAAINHAATWQTFMTEGSGVNQSRSSAGSGLHINAAAISSVTLSMAAAGVGWESGSTLRVYGLGLI